ncbi:MAG: preprotein translocase subunit SecG [Oscillospiraceae bacterium]|jgi:protein translocase SecG subunit|nr:preprotein translocase subunit SecG [Oscillospiraceae bacterium]
MSVCEYIVGGLILGFSVFLIVVIMLQESNSNGLASVNESTSDSFYNTQSKGRTLDAKLARLTKISAVLLIVLIVLLGFLYQYKKT